HLDGGVRRSAADYPAREEQDHRPGARPGRTLAPTVAMTSPDRSLRAFDPLRQPLAVLDESLHFDLAALVIRRPKDRRRMDGGHHQRQAGALDELTTLKAHPEVAPKQRLRRRGTEQHQDPRLDKGD